MSDMMRQAFASSGTIGDTALTAMMQFGLITAADGSAASMTMLDAATREQLIAQLVLAVDTVMRLEIPMQMATALWRRACWDRLRFAKACFRAATRWITRRFARGPCPRAGDVCWARRWRRCMC